MSKIEALLILWAKMYWISYSVQLLTMLVFFANIQNAPIPFAILFGISSIIHGVYRRKLRRYLGRGFELWHYGGYTIHEVLNE